MREYKGFHANQQTVNALGSNHYGDDLSIMSTMSFLAILVLQGGAISRDPLQASSGSNKKMTEQQAQDIGRHELPSGPHAGRDGGRQVQVLQGLLPLSCTQQLTQL